MNLSESSHIWRRHWKMTVTLVVLASTGAVAAVTMLPRSYQSDSSVVLLASRSAARLNGGNPYLSFSPSLTLTADALSLEMMAPGTAKDLAARGFPGSYAVALSPGENTVTTGSVLDVTVIDSSQAAAEDTLRAVTDQISVELTQMQGGIRPGDRIRAATLSFSPQAALSVSQTARPLVAVIALGLLLAFGIPIVVDGRITRRRIQAGALLPDLPPDRVDRLASGPAAMAHQPAGYWSPAARHGGNAHPASGARRSAD
jgi:hypothetical protein